MASIFVLGDSISIQYGPHLEALVRGRLAYARKDGTEAALQNLDIPQGANGGDSRMCRAYLETRCADPAFRPDLLLWNCGLHDIKRARDTATLQVSAGDYRANLQAATALLARRGIALAWIRTTPVDDDQHNARSKDFTRAHADQQAYNAIADAVMAEAGARSIDLEACSRACGGVEIFCDHVHFTEPVRRTQGAFVAGHCLAWLG